MSTRLQRWISRVVPLLLLFGMVALRAMDPWVMEQLRNIVFDTYQNIKPRSHDPAKSPVRIVDIDDESLRRLGQWPWPRTIMARLVGRLHEGGAIVVAFDIIFAEPDRMSPRQALKTWPDVPELKALRDRGNTLPDNDEMLAKAMRRGRTVTAFALVNRKTKTLPQVKTGFGYGGYSPLPFIYAFDGGVSTIPVLTSAAAGNGAANWVPDRDQILRRVPTVFRVGETIYPTLFAEVLRVGVGAGGYKIRTTAASGDTTGGAKTGITALQIGNASVPTDANGRMLLYFAPHDRSRYIPAWRILAGEIPANQIKGRVFLIGTSAAGLRDIRATPLSTSVPGVEAHAQAIEQVITGVYLLRPDFADGIEIVVLFLAGLGIILLLPKLGAWMAMAIFFPIVLLLAWGGWYLFDQYRLVLDGIYPAVGVLVVFLSMTLANFLMAERQRNQIRNAFSHYLSPDLVKRLADQPGQLRLGGESRRMSILFSDVRNFTNISEKLDAEALAQFMNRYLTKMTDAILRHGGTVDKYIGDAIMAFWNAPLVDDDHPSNACKAALAMIEGLEQVNQELRAQEGWPLEDDIRIGIGINTGHCSVGNFGSEQRFDYSVLGDDVNVAARLEGLSKTYGVSTLIGEETRAATSEFAAVELDLVRVKGRAAASRIYLLAGGEDYAQSREFTEWNDRQKSMLSAYRGQDWSKCKAAIAACREASNGRIDGYYRLIEARMDGFMAEPPPSDWDGVHVAMTK